MRKLYRVTLTLLTVAVVIIAYQLGKNTAAKVPPKVIVKQSPPKVVEIQPKGIVISVTITDLKRMLDRKASHLSSKMKNRVLSSVAIAADRYKISPLVLLSVIQVESSFRPQITHHQVVIKGKKDHAIGLTGVLPIWWLKPLRKAGIIETRYDLYNIEENILSCAYILNEYRKMPLKSGVSTPMQSALLRYFGGNYKSYLNKIEANIGSLIFKKVYQ